MYNFNRFEDRMNDHRGFDGRESFGGHGMGRRHHEPFGPDMDRPERGFHRAPQGGFQPGMPPHGGRHPRGMGPGFPGMPPHGMGPRRPDREFLQRRLDEADLAELIDMAGRLLRRRPQGGPAQGQTLILAILAGRETITQRDLQQMLGIQPGSLSELVSKLEAKGLVTRERAEDRRGNLLRITDAGRKASVAQPETDAKDDPFSPLTAQQQDQLSDLLRTLLNHWVSEVDDPPRGPHGLRGQKPVEV